MYILFFIMKKILPLLIWLLGTILGRTWRVKVISPPSVSAFDPFAAPKIYCFWHSTLLVISYLFRNTGKTAIVSHSRDGQLAAAVARRWGHGIVFGSSTRGGAAALRQSVKAIRDGQSLGITPDGPRGPKEVAKPGAAQIAIVSQTPLVTIKVCARGAWRLNSWDRFMIPLPFAKITITLSEPIEPPARGGEGVAAINGGNDASLTELTRQIEGNLAL
jgi:hypothetical protein